MTDRHPENLPLVEPLPAGVTAVAAFRRLSERPSCLFLDSALPHATLGRYSFVAVDPYKQIRCERDAADAWERIQQELNRCPAPDREDLPPFQGGAAGLFGYELNRSLEPRLQSTASAVRDEFRTPVLQIGFYDCVFAFDHERSQGWLISTGWPEQDAASRIERAARRRDQMLQWLDEPEPQPSTGGQPRRREFACPGFDARQLIERSHATPFEGVLSNFDADRFRRSVERAVEYIFAGDIFQVNFAQRLLFRSDDDPRRLYERMRTCNAATFAAYFDLGDRQLVSASPERFLATRGGRIETRPIKGTRPRVQRPEADLFAATDLQDSEKDNAENVMIVDLLRNDLSRVCRPDSIRVEQLCEVESYAFVQHLVSSVTGQLRAECEPLDAVRAAFPGGSITGAPKIRAMEIIAELEQTARGAYCGSLGYVGYNGAMDLSILIRTITACGDWWQFPVGGGVVSLSTAENEYQETWHKAAGMLRALRDGNA